MLKRICRLLLRLWGWKIEGHFPTDLPKYVLIGGPHTSNWDFILSLMVRLVQGVDIKFIGKKSLFVFPFGFLFKLLGGFPVDRQQRSNFVETMIKFFEEKEQFKVAITPEGTRKRVDKFKSGFYYIAQGANVPIVPVIFNGGQKIYQILPPVNLSGDMEKDMEKLVAYFRGIKGIRQENSIFFSLF